MSRNNPIDDIRQALSRHDEWPTRDTATAVVQAARSLIRTIDMQAQVIEQMRQATPTDEAIAEIMRHTSHG